MTADPAPHRGDASEVERLLGRRPQGDYEVVVRHPDGSPLVIRNAPLLLQVRLRVGHAVPHTLPRATRHLPHSDGGALQDRRDLGELHPEHVVQHECQSLSWLERLEHDEQSETDRQQASTPRLDTGYADFALESYETFQRLRQARMSRDTQNVSLATGLPLISHTENASCGHDQIDIVTGEGVPASQLLVGHSDGRDDHDYQKSLAERGAYVGFDRFGLEMIVPDKIRMQNVKKLVDAGHRDRVLMSHDTVHCFLGGLPGGMSQQQFEAMVPNWRLTHIFENVFPRLRELGLRDADLEHIVTDNPRRFFTEAAARHS